MRDPSSCRAGIVRIAGSADEPAPRRRVRPLDQSDLWTAHHAYFANRGVSAWTERADGAMVVINDDGPASLAPLRGLRQGVPTLYGATLNSGVLFAVFDSFADRAGLVHQRGRRFGQEDQPHDHH